MSTVDQRLEEKIAVHVELNDNLLADQTGFFSPAEDERLDFGFAAARFEFEAAREFAGGEIIGLIDHRDRGGRIGQPHACELNVACERVGRDRDRLDQTLRVLARVPAEEREPGSQRHRADAQTDNPVCNVGRKLVSRGALHRRRT